MQKAIQVKQFKYKDKHIYILQDFPSEIAKKKWGAYYDLNRELKSRADVRYGLEEV